MNPDIKAFNEKQSPPDQEICNLLAKTINAELPEAENKIWHAHPVWFLEGNPVVGYSKLKDCVRLFFWSGQSFEENELQKSGTFKATERRYTSVDQIDTTNIKRWLQKARDIQWDYKNIMKHKGKLERIK